MTDKNYVKRTHVLTHLKVRRLLVIMLPSSICGSGV